MSLLVPVFTAEKKRVASGLSKPNVRVRALLSARTVVTMKLASRLKARVSLTADADAVAADALRGRSNVGRGTPPFASVRYALVSVIRFTSALPSARL